MSRSKYTEAAPLTGPSWWAAALALAVALLLQIELLPLVRVHNAPVSLVLIVVVWYAVRADVFHAAVFGLIAGLLEDVFATGTGAGWTIATTLTAVCAGMLSRGFFADSIPLFAIIVAITTVVRDAIFWIVMWLQGYPQGYGSIHFHQTLWQSLLDALAAAAIMAAIRFRDARR